MGQIRKLFQGLHWKLTLSYTLVTVAALLVVQIAIAVLVWVVITNSSIYPRALIVVVKDEIVPQIKNYLEPPDPDVKGLGGWLQAAETSAGLTFQSLNFPVAQVSLSDFDDDTTLLVLDRDLNFLAGIPGSIFDDYKIILDQADDVVAAALSGEVDPQKISIITPNKSITVAVPVMDETHGLLGVIVLKTVYPPRGILIGMFSYIGGSLIFLTIAAGLVGTVFGYITARGLTRRLHNVTRATDDWSRGDFSGFIQERSEDELGQLAQRLNRMAEQLQNLLHTRQELAALEERNRLARDLHDSVKQQVFATTMQVGAARALIEREGGLALQHLDEAERLARQAQTELTAIIRELRPSMLKEKGLVQALEEIITDWSRLNHIPVETRLENAGPLPLDIEEILYRVVQEAFANIAKHSQANQVKIQLSCVNNDISLEICDDGVGFDISSARVKGEGLRSMHERMGSLGGMLTLQSEPGKGTCILAQCPIIKGVSE